jgi:hypothetical protein
MYYEHYYRHLLGDIDLHDLDMLLDAEFQQPEEMHPDKAHDTRVAEALKDILRLKHHQIEANNDYV